MGLLDSEDSAGTSGDEVPQEPSGGNGRNLAISYTLRVQCTQWVPL